MHSSKIWQGEPAAQTTEPPHAEDGSPTTLSAPSEQTAHERFALVYEQYRPRIYAYLRTRTTWPEDAADLTHQVFLQALRGLAGYHGTTASARTSWLFSIARNAATDAQRKQRTSGRCIVTQTDRLAQTYPDLIAAFDDPAGRSALDVLDQLYGQPRSLTDSEPSAVPSTANYLENRAQATPIAFKLATTQRRTLVRGYRRTRLGVAAACIAVLIALLVTMFGTSPGPHQPCACSTRGA